MSAQDRIVEAMAAAAANESGGYDMWKGLAEFKKAKWRDIAQAALTAALPLLREEFAKLAEAHADDRGGRDRPFDWHDGYMDACRNAATAIRALDLGKEEG